jgi:hypothetical protein
MIGQFDFDPRTTEELRDKGIPSMRFERPPAALRSEPRPGRGRIQQQDARLAVASELTIL